MSNLFQRFVILIMLVSNGYSYVAQMRERDDIFQVPYEISNPPDNLFGNRKVQVQPQVNSRPDRRAYDSQDLQKSEGKEGLEAVIFSIDTGVRPTKKVDARKRMIENGDGVDKLTSLLKELTSSKGSDPILQARKFGLKPEYVNLKSANQPSLKFEVNSQSIMKAIEQVLSSPITRRYADLAAKHAAAYYKVIVDEFKNPTPDVQRI